MSSRGRRAVAAGVVVSLVASLACSGGDGDDPPGPAGRGAGDHPGPAESAEQADTADTVDPVAPAELASTSVSVERVPHDRQVFGVLGDVLFAYDFANERRIVVASTDRGATWAPLDLPGLPVIFVLSVHVVGDVAVVGGVSFEAGGARVHLWTSEDGRVWRGGRAEGEVEPGAGRVQTVGRSVDGDLLALVQDGVDHVLAVVRSDDGVTWDVVECPDEAEEYDAACTPVTAVGDLSFAVWDGRVSVDGGGTWQAPQLDPDPAEDDIGDSTALLRSAAELPGGGWVGTAEWFDVGYLVRSDDGTRWDQLISPDPCGDDPMRARRTTRYRGPVRLGDGWLVAYGCWSSSGPERAELFLLDAEGKDPRRVEGSRLAPGLAYGPLFPLGDGEGVVAPVDDAHGEASGDALLLRP